MLAKSAKYFADGEAVKTQAAAATVRRPLHRIIDDPDELVVTGVHELAAALQASDLSREVPAGTGRGNRPGSTLSVFDRVWRAA